ncbi:MAG: response regulator, partial [Dinghuibacter sp.]|nr:response regulator [Dinghuibacter sp.]
MSFPVLKCIVVDDEPPAIKLIVNYIRKTPSLTCVEQFTNPLEALNWTTQNTVDLVFLDISMPQLNGLEFARLLKGKARVILCTAYREYGAESYEYGVTDYLVKPVSYTRFLEAVQKVLETIKQP